MKYTILLFMLTGLTLLFNQTFAAKPSGIFDDYTSWTKSSSQKPNDTASWILDMLSINNFTTNAAGSITSISGQSNGITLSDINGDGLVDFIYSRNYLDSYGFLASTRTAILINNGNYTFKSAYKCVYIKEPATYVNGQYIYPEYFYGDCANK